ncbi:MAG TPA: PEP-utilizing enzyme [Alphaproteobacteria bacterium]|nr:PEP-utilizing enzyme [Alphaproteobacteria bacterium]
MAQEILWLSFPEESVAQRDFSDAVRARFEGIFSLADSTSPWRRALKMLGMTPPPADVQMIFWHQGAPYLNGSALAVILSDGTAVAMPDAARGFRFVTPHKIRSIPRVMAAQWRVTRFVQDRLRDITKPDADAIAESLALGLAVQVLLMRLNAAAAARMPEYLAAPDRAPAMHRQTFRWLQALQVRRTALSPAWHAMFADAAESAYSRSLPPFFWAGETAAGLALAPLSVPDVQKAAGGLVSAGLFRGLTVSGGQAAGQGIVVKRLQDAPQYADRPIFIFRHARPETTVYFSQAAAVLFANGGVLSHACVVAREMGVPCITGLGDEFYEQMAQGETPHLSVDAQNAEVRITA